MFATQSPHPITQDVSFEDAMNVLYHARKILDFWGIPPPQRKYRDSSQAFWVALAEPKKSSWQNFRQLMK